MEERTYKKRPRSLMLAPVFVRVDERRHVLPPPPRPSWQELVIGWLRYQAVQIRWDLERGLARLLHRSWIDPRRTRRGRERGDHH
ncbi:hypothetical protein [Thermogemmatispora sp.]|uniref:hypothetical protein n=1 Tax=Thermogemmatispora sp. TaxID=1968838 RepID=UPI001DD076B7|nr:hypothetical protein [Thermogemmatispora sp.]MBX5451437.1 hypothetical protein [Thermogemmatispora sp.]